MFRYKEAEKKGSVGDADGSKKKVCLYLCACVCDVGYS